MRLLSLIGKWFDLAIEIMAWLTLIACVLGGAIGGAVSNGFFGFIFGLIGGTVMGAILLVLFFGFIALFLNIVKDTKAINEKLDKIIADKN